MAALRGHRGFRYRRRLSNCRDGARPVAIRALCASELKTARLHEKVALLRHDRRHVINYAQWEDEASFRGFIEDPEGERLQAAIHALDPSLKPNAAHCRVVRTTEGSE